MLGQEIEQSSDEQKTLALLGNSETLPITDKVVNRIVVYGSNGTGGYILVRSLQKFMHERIPGAKIDYLRNVRHIVDAFFGLYPDEKVEPTLPKGVILLPEMRQYDERSFHGMTLTTEDSRRDHGITILDDIKSLCDRFGVPLARLRAIEEGDSKKIMASLEKIASSV